jgi:hypothetical protein
VHRLAGCLDELRYASRRVLMLRSGYGPGAPLSRSQVVDRLDLAARRVKRLERRGLRRLRTLQRQVGCGGNAASSTVAGSTGDTRFAPRPGVLEDTSGGSDGGVGNGGVAGAFRTGLATPAFAVEDIFESSPDSSSSSSSKPPAWFVQQPSDGIGIWSLLAFVAGLGLLGFAVRRELQR